jgi:diazepam-binding inhibitor (GABA receptor modulator, acyl-CoA-binding protein)
MQELPQSFQNAAQAVKKLKSTPSNSELLQLYALYKQATDGEVSGKRPGMLDLKGRAKFDAWTALQGTSKDQAMKRYVELVEALQKKYGV